MPNTLTTKGLNPIRDSVLIEGEVFGEYFQSDYFQPLYFQTGGLFVSGNTPAETVSLDLKRTTVRLAEL